MRKFSGFIILLLIAANIISLCATENTFSVNFDNYNFSGQYGNQRIAPWRNHTRKFVSGRSGGALHITAPADALEFTLPSFNPDEGTIECFLKLPVDAQPGRRYIFTLHQGDKDFLMRARLDDFHQLTMEAHFGRVSGGVSGGVTFPVDIKRYWLHFAVCWKKQPTGKTDFSIYMNGQRVVHTSRDNGFSLQSRNPSLVLGGWLNKNIPFTGMIDEFIISDRAKYTQESISGVVVGFDSRELLEQAQKRKARIAKFTSDSNASRKLMTDFLAIETAITGLDRLQEDKLPNAFMNLQERLEQLDNQIALYEFWEQEPEKSFALVQVDSMTKYADDWTYLRHGQSPSRIFSAGNEYSIMQFLIVPQPGFKSEKYRIEVSKFKDCSGLAADIAMEAFQVDATRLNYLQPPEWCADILTPLKGHELKFNGELYKPLFLTFYTTPEVKPGRYTATLRVTAESHSEEIPLEISVYAFALPGTSQLQTSFGFLTSLIPGYYKVKETSEKFKQLRKAYLDNMLKHRVSPKSAVRGQSFEAINFLAPVAVKTRTGEWKMNFSHYEQELDYLLARGLNTIMVGHRDRVPKPEQRFVSYPYFDETDNKYKMLKFEFMSDEMKKFGTWYTRNWYDFLKAKGLEKMAYTYVYDEPRDDAIFRNITRACKWLTEAAPGLPHMMTASPPNASYDAIDIWCPLNTEIENNPALQAQLKHGKRLWTYVCCVPTSPHLNLLMRQSGTANRAVFWHAYKFGAEGFLYYEHASSMSSWRKKVMGDVRVDPRFDRMPDTEGDGFLVYPGPDGPINSIRFEYVRQGIQDIDYFLMLKELSDGLPHGSTLKKQAEQLLIIPDHLLKSTAEYCREWDKYAERKHQVGLMIEKISKELKHAK